MESSLTHRFVDVNGIRLHIAEQGQGPLVLLLHGWPESWYSWRHQFGPLAAAGYRVVAPDQRGYARSEQPPDVTSYTLLHLVGDVIALIEELGEEQAIVVGHDWGAPVAWTAAMLRPDKVRAVARLSVPPDTSSTTMRVATDATIRAIQRRGSGASASWAFPAVRAGVDIGSSPEQ
ncbi:alpha/beta fold hydrolase [Kitasatospora aureofaciens]|uniref:alpha/beta fold hydrolase n=1 Tax=Kitasatospora aureofaciens TaxID=1894 RepID=UPI000A8974C2|nr:alpha/beta hydrolase [Kitasatospora aureofaciens]